MAKFVGHTRFSVFNPRNPGWRLSTEDDPSDASYKSLLYAEDRLEFRTRVFTQLAVPAMAQAAKGHEVHHVVSFSESLPEKYKSQLHETAKKFPLLVLHELEDGAPPNIRSLYKNFLSVGDVFANYRLDDDDILSIHFYNQVAKYVDEHFVGMMVSLPLGIETVQSGGIISNIRQAHVPMHSMGLTGIFRYRGDTNLEGPVEGPHDKSDRHAPVIIDSRRIGYLRINHLGQDNVLKHEKESVEKQLIGSMEKFPLVTDPAVLEENFPEVSRAILEDDSFTLPLVSDEPIRELFVSLKNPTSILTVEIDVVQMDETARRDYVVAYQLVRSGEMSVSPGEKVLGIGTSNFPHIGQYQYLDLDSQGAPVLTSVFLPSEFKIHGFRILYIGNSKPHLCVSKLRIKGGGEAIRQEKHDFMRGSGRGESRVGQVSVFASKVISRSIRTSLGRRMVGLVRTFLDSPENAKLVKQVRMKANSLLR